MITPERYTLYRLVALRFDRLLIETLFPYIAADSHVSATIRR